MPFKRRVIPNRISLQEYKEEIGKVSEDQLHIEFAQWLRETYPEILFRTDFAAGTKLSKTQAMRNKRMQMTESKGWCDVFIAEARDSFYKSIPELKALTKVSYHGLFLELKTEDVKLFLKDGVTMVASEHFRQQEKIMEMLRNKGYAAHFAVGLENAKRITINYLT